MPDFDEHTHGIQIMYTEGDQTTVDICDHVDYERALKLLCTAIHAVAGMHDMPTDRLITVLKRKMPDFEIEVRNWRN